MHDSLICKEEMRPALLNDSDAISVRGCHQYAVIVGDMVISFVSVVSRLHHWASLRSGGYQQPQAE